MALSTYEKEMIALVKSVKKWRLYLLGKPFVVRTDHKSLKYLLEQQISTPAQTRWLSKLLGYDYEIEYKKRLENQAADSLSQVVEFQLISTSMLKADWWTTLQQKVQQDSFYRHLDLVDDPRLQLCDGVWFKNHKILLSPSSSLIQKVIADCHSSPISGHFGYHKTLSRIKHSFF